MNKLFTKIAGVFLGLAMAVGVGVAVSDKPMRVAAAESVAYTLTPAKTTNSSYAGSKEVTIEHIGWTVEGNGTMLPWRLGGNQITSKERRVYSNNPVSEQDISKVVLSVGKAESINVNTLTLKVGSSDQGDDISSVSATFKPSSDIVFEKPSGADWSNKYFTFAFNLTVSGNKNKFVEFKSAKFYYGLTSTATSILVLDESGGTVTDSSNRDLVANGETATTSLTCAVSYSDAADDGNVTIVSTPSDNFSYSTSDNETYELSFSSNGDYAVKVASTADPSISVTINYHVSGIVSVVYKKITNVSNLKAGNQVIIGKFDGTFVLGKYVSGNNSPALSLKPTNTDSILRSELPSNYALLTLGGSAGKWTLTDQDGLVYFGVNGENYLKASKSSTDTWNIVINSDGTASLHSNATESNRYLQKNSGNALFACYTSSQHDISLYAIPSTDPAIEVTVAGSTALGVGETTQLTATKINGATGTVSWLTDNNHVELSATTGDSITVTGKTDGTTNVRATLTGGSTVDPVVTTFTVSKKLSSIQVATAPNKIVYTEGEAFDKTGMVILATYDDGSTENPTDFTYTPDGALTPSDKEVTISWGGKTVTQPITVNVKVVASISVNQVPTKARYHAGDDFDSTGLKINVSYENGEPAVITSGFVVSPESYKFTVEDETIGTKEFTVTYGGKSTTFIVVVEPASGPIENGRYYIMNSNKTRGLNAKKATSSPKAVDLSVSNELTAFDVELKNDNEYEISVTIDNVKHLLVCNTTEPSGSNDKICILTKPTGLKSTNWVLDNEGVEAAGAYRVKMNTTGSTYRYLAYYETSSTQDWRGYTGKNGNQEIQFVKEGSYANTIATSLLNTVVCDGGVNAPNNANWNNASNAYSKVTIAHEKDLLAKGTANVDSENIIEKALAKYDYIVSKYNKDGAVAYNDFLGRNPSAAGASSKLVNTAINNMNTSAVVALVSMLSAGLAGSYCILRHKRKEQN